jgi:MraZ protein
MSGFVSNHTNRIDGKGRVSIPAGFRAVLVRDGYEGLYCYPSLDMNAVDAGGNGLFRAIEQRLSKIETYTEAHDYLSTAFYGMGEHLKIDQDGRVSLTDSLKGYAGIDTHVTFVGQGYKFQIWSPDRFQEHSRKAMELARQLRQTGQVAGGVQ